MFTIPDANADWVNPADDQQLLGLQPQSRNVRQDRYLLTNPDVEAATMGAVVVSAEVEKPRVLFRIGGTASASVGSGGNRGFTAIENDQAIAGRAVHESQRVDLRARAPVQRSRLHDQVDGHRSPAVRGSVGALARFQDGQPFSRLAIVPFLNQGAEAIQAFPRGRSRFSYRATLDVRLQKSFAVGASQTRSVRRRLQPAQRLVGSGRICGDGSALPRDHGGAAAALVPPRRARQL